MKKPEKVCPECGCKLIWISITSSLGAPSVSSHCPKCCIVFRNRECPQVTKGLKIKEIDGTPIDKIHAMDKRITNLSCNTQIGILRKRQHPEYYK